MDSMRPDEVDVSIRDLIAAAQSPSTRGVVRNRALSILSQVGDQRTIWTGALVPRKHLLQIHDQRLRFQLKRGRVVTVGLDTLVFELRQVKSDSILLVSLQEATFIAHFFLTQDHERILEVHSSLQV